MEKFIYVFNEQDKEALVNHGFQILKDDMSPYIFKNDSKITSSFSDMKIIFKDEMLF